MSRIYFSAWGQGTSNLNMPAYAMTRFESMSDAECVASAICRKNNKVMIVLRRDSTSRERAIYQMALGTPLRSGGFGDIQRVWFSVGAPTV